MFLVKDRRLGMDNYLFTHVDPREDGYKGDVLEGVSLDYDMNDIHLWPDGQPRPNPQLGRDPANLKQYKVFKFPEDLRAAGFEFIHDSAPFVDLSWSDYRKHYYPMPAEYAQRMTQDEWFDFLEEADAATRIRKEAKGTAEPKPGSTRDQIAKWVANRHMAADGGIQQIWYLRSAAPDDEIRLLEVSERFTGTNGKVQPVDFTLDVADARVKLVVGDVSVAQLERIQAEPADRLPNGWKLDDAVVWNRREFR